VAEAAGRIAAYGGLFRDDWMLPARTGDFDVLVSPAHRRRGIGTHLLDCIVRESVGLELRSLRAVAREQQHGLLTFLQGRGFAEQQRSWTLELDVETASVERFHTSVARAEAGGITFSTMAAERASDPEYALKVHEIWCDVSADQPGYDSTQRPPFEPFREWLERPWRLTDGCFIAKDGDRYVGLCMLQGRSETAGALLQNITGVRRGYRRRGLATAMKVLTIDYARRQGDRLIRTTNNSQNLPMLHLNEAIGFRREQGTVTLARELGA